jgi:hypothetical protein
LTVAVNLAEDLRASLQDILVSGTVEIRENGSRVTSAAPLLSASPKTGAAASV